MGVPGFFAWINKRYSSKGTIVDFNKSTMKVNELFLDANSIIYNVIKDVPTELTSKDEIERLIIKLTIEHILTLYDLIKPSDIMMISIDGVAPCAKIIQQRNRRYLSTYQEVLINEAKKKYNIKSLNWTRLNITPGTVFMEKLHKSLEDFVSKFNKSHKCKMIYTSYNDYGEGEHKIIDYIKSNPVETSKVRYIYGLDADLLFLTMSLSNNNIFLIRENIVKSEETEEYVYQVVNIDKLKHNLYHYCQTHDRELKYSQNLINDIIFICFLFGNDFIPTAQIFSIHDDMGIFIDGYMTSKTEMGGQDAYLTNENNINMIFFNSFLNYLSTKEQELYTKGIYQKRMEKFNIRNKCIAKDKKGFDLEQFKIDTLIYPELTHYHPSFAQYKKNTYCIYHKYPNTDDMHKIFVKYITGLMWNYFYYFKISPKTLDGKTMKLTNMWNYQYPFAPFISDLHNFISFNMFNVNVNFSKFNSDCIDVIDDKIQLNPYQQLICVIPYTKLKEVNEELFNKVCSDSYVQLINPLSYGVYTYNCLQFYKCKANVPFISFDKIIKMVI